MSGYSTHHSQSPAIAPNNCDLTPLTQMQTCEQHCIDLTASNMPSFNMYFCNTPNIKLLQHSSKVFWKN